MEWDTSSCEAATTHSPKWGEAAPVKLYMAVSSHHIGIWIINRII